VWFVADDQFVQVDTRAGHRFNIRCHNRRDQFGSDNLGFVAFSVDHGLARHPGGNATSDDRPHRPPSDGGAHDPGNVGTHDDGGYGFLSPSHEQRRLL
jgi:hypothetical protein